MNTRFSPCVNRIRTRRAQAKREIIAAYCDGWISANFAQAVIDALDLRGA